jgi:hypothetical protein
MSKRSDPESDAWMHPRDILTPTATLLGLVIAAIGLSNTILGGSAALQALSMVLVLVVLLFAGSALVTCIASLRRSHRLLRVGIVLFAMGWGFTALVVSLFLLGNAWGIEIFQITIPPFPNLDIATVLSSVFSLLSATAAILNFRRSKIDKAQLISLTNQLAADQQKTQSILGGALDPEPNDPKMALVRLAIELERVLRKKATSQAFPDRDVSKASMGRIIDFLLSRQLISHATANSIGLVWNARNKIVHSGGDISSNDSRAVLSLAAAVLSELSSES